MRYSLNQKQQLMAFLDYGDVPISNRLAENVIRPFVVDRKTGYSVTAPRVQNPAPLYIAWWNGIGPYAYQMLVLSMLPYLGKFPPHEELEKLMPWHPAVRHREHIRK